MAVPVNTTVIAAVVTQSELNILTWLTYLPRACVKQMINMGWDKNT